MSANGRTNVYRTNTNRGTTTGGSYMYVGIFIFLLAGVLIYVFWGKITGKPSTSIDLANFSGTLIGSRVTGNLSDITKAMQSSPAPPSLIVYVLDCSNNILWKTGNPFPTSSGTGVYTMVSKGMKLQEYNKTNKIGETWSMSVSHHIAPNVQLESLILSNTSIDDAQYTSLSDTDYIKKIMSLVTHEYPKNIC